MLHHMTSRALSSSAALNSKLNKRLRDLRKQVLKEKFERSPDDVLRLAIDCSLNSHYKMTAKVGGWTESAILQPLKLLCKHCMSQSGTEGPGEADLFQLRKCSAVP